jgi:NodT family efflux transporter outer membrane factor (OMF) lipoprotein
MSPRLALAPLLAAVALSACALRPDRAVHPAPLDSAALGLAAAPAPAVSEHWWAAFADPQLDQLVAQATRDNPSLTDALARLARARAEALEARSARQPHVDASADIYRERYSADYIYPPPYGGGSYWDSQLGLGLTWNPDFWGRQRDLIHASDRSARARQLDARAAELAIEGALVTAYLELDRSHRLADINRDAELTRAHMADLTQRRMAAGLDTTIDVRYAAAFVPEARTDRDQTRVAIELGVHRIAALTGQGARAYAQVARPQLTYSDALPLPPALPGDLLLRRPDVQAALARVEAATAAEDAARLAAYPEINLRAFAGFAALTLSDLLSAPARTYGLGPSVRLPIFDAGLLRSRLRGAGADLESAVAQYNATVLSAVRDVADGLTTADALGRETRDAEQRL